MGFFTIITSPSTKRGEQTYKTVIDFLKRFMQVNLMMLKIFLDSSQTKNTGNEYPSLKSKLNTADHHNRSRSSDRCHAKTRKNHSGYGESEKCSFIYNHT